MELGLDLSIELGGNLVKNELGVELINKTYEGFVIELIIVLAKKDEGLVLEIGGDLIRIGDDNEDLLKNIELGGDLVRRDEGKDDDDLVKKTLPRSSGIELF